MLNRLWYWVKYWYRLIILKDVFLWEARRWFKDDGDETLRLDYPLNQEAVVVDVGGYMGDFADAIHRQYGCKVFVFEPVEKYSAQCESRFKSNPEVTVINEALGGENGEFLIDLAGDASSLSTSVDATSKERVKMRQAGERFDELGIRNIDLMKINIEGGEYDLIQGLLDSGWMPHIRFLQIQFHNFIPNAIDKRSRIRSQLDQTHREDWNYEFVWESWSRR